MLSSSLYIYIYRVEEEFWRPLSDPDFGVSCLRSFPGGRLWTQMRPSAFVFSSGQENSPASARLFLSFLPSVSYHKTQRPVSAQNGPKRPKTAQSGSTFQNFLIPRDDTAVIGHDNGAELIFAGLRDTIRTHDGQMPKQKAETGPGSENTGDVSLQLFRIRRKRRNSNDIMAGRMPDYTQRVLFRILRLSGITPG